MAKSNDNACEMHRPNKQSSVGYTSIPRTAEVVSHPANVVEEFDGKKACAAVSWLPFNSLAERQLMNIEICSFFLGASSSGFHGSPPRGW